MTRLLDFGRRALQAIDPSRREKLSTELFLRHALNLPRGSYFEEDFYRQTHPDVDEAVRRGQITSGFEHFVRAGLAEGRVAIPDFDEDFYLATYPYIADAVKEGEFASPFQHYVLFGVKEHLARCAADEIFSRLPRKNLAPVAVKQEEDLLTAHTTSNVLLEFTSRCNLRCVYCAVSQPEYRGIDMDFLDFENLIDSLRERKVTLVSVNGHGETTMVKGWESYCARLINAGFRLHLISNFARPFSDDEAAVLAKFYSIEVSCDTFDPLLFAQMRRGGDVRTIIYNIGKVRAAALQLRIPGPMFSLSCVVADRNVLRLPEFAQYGLASGIRRFRFMNLTKMKDLGGGAINVRHIGELEPEDREEAHRAMQESFAIIEKNGGVYFCEPGLLDVAAASPEERAQLDHYHPSVVGEKHTYSSTALSGQTRDCLDPWEFAYIHADRSVRPCCVLEETYGSIANGQKLSDVLNNDKMRELRRELLTGELNAGCAGCPSRSLVSVEAFRAKMAARIT